MSSYCGIFICDEAAPYLPPEAGREGERKKKNKRCRTPANADPCSPHAPCSICQQNFEAPLLPALLQLLPAHPIDDCFLHIVGRRLRRAGDVVPDSRSFSSGPTHSVRKATLLARQSRLAEAGPRSGVVTAGGVPDLFALKKSRRAISVARPPSAASRSAFSLSLPSSPDRGTSRSSMLVVKSFIRLLLLPLPSDEREELWPPFEWSMQSVMEEKGSVTVLGSLEPLLEKGEGCVRQREGMQYFSSKGLQAGMLAVMMVRLISKAEAMATGASDQVGSSEL